MGIHQLVCGLMAWGISATMAVAETTKPASNPANKPIAHDVHDGYFVSNKFEPAAPQSYVLLRDQAEFDHVFGVGMVMGDKSHRLPANAFDKKMVVAAIHRGKAMVTYQVKDVTAEGNTLVVRYEVISQPQKDTEFACPLIVSVERGDYQTIRFVENGRVAKRLTVNPPDQNQKTGSAKPSI